MTKVDPSPFACYTVQRMRAEKKTKKENAFEVALCDVTKGADVSTQVKDDILGKMTVFVAFHTSKII